ncbi:MAG: protein translocase subunit SecF [Acidimicrobiia bacterium]
MSLRSQLSDILHERTNYDFVGPKRKWFAISGILILMGVGALLIRGLDLGIDFEGGTSWQVEVAEGVDPSTGDVRAEMEEAGLDSPEVAILGGDEIRVQALRTTGDAQEEVAEALAEYASVEVDQVSINDVGPTWGDQVSSKAARALVVFFVVIAAYLSFRFEPKMAVAALAAVLHDILITVGAYAVTGFEVAPATVIAFLTILGFSLYDTVIVFDKVNENTALLGAGGRETYSDMVNRSMNSVLMRSLNTSIVSSLPVFSLLIVGAYVFNALTLRDFALALSVGIVTGAYSSIFIATPILAVLKEREPRFKAMRQRVARAGVGAGVGAPAPLGTYASGSGPAVDAGPTAGADGFGEGEEGAEVAGEPVERRVVAPSRPPPRRPGTPPRPRKKGRRR